MRINRSNVRSIDKANGARFGFICHTHEHWQRGTLRRTVRPRECVFECVFECVCWFSYEFRTLPLSVTFLSPGLFSHFANMVIAQCGKSVPRMTLSICLFLFFLQANRRYNAALSTFFSCIALPWSKCADWHLLAVVAFCSIGLIWVCVVVLCQPGPHIAYCKKSCSISGWNYGWNNTKHTRLEV